MENSVEQKLAALTVPVVVSTPDGMEPQQRAIATPRRNQDQTGPRLTAASNDQEAVATWLAKYRDNKHTLDSYRREAERLLMWAQWIGRDLPGLMVEDVLAYKAFLIDPQPVAQWCLQTEPRLLPDGKDNPLWRQVRRVPRELESGEPNPAWRPFVSGLSAAAAKQSTTILFGLFEHLAAIGYLHANPLRAASKRATRTKKRGQERYFDDAAWSEILNWVERMPKEEPRDVAHYWRTRFLFRLLYLTGLRRFELAQARTSHLRFQRGQWWLDVLGKGSVEDSVPLPMDAIEAIKEYRESTGRPALPPIGTDEPLLMDVTGAGRPLGDRAIYAVVKEVCRRTAAYVGVENPELAKQIQAGSTHWLRHTAATHQIEAGVDPLIVQANLRHASFSTTEIYIHKGRDKQHAETEKHVVECEIQK